MKKPFRQRRNQPSVLLNTAITFPQIRLIDPNGAFIGIVDNKTALAKAKDLGLDLICTTVKADPPVCKIQDFGKWNYEKQKKDKQKKKLECFVFDLKYSPISSQNTSYISSKLELKKMLLKEVVMQELRDRRYYMKHSIVKREDKKRAIRRAAKLRRER